MPIVQNIPRKQGRIFTSPVDLPRRTTVFGVAQDTAQPVDNTTAIPDATVSSGARNVIASTGGNANPVANMQNTATQRYIRQASVVGNAKQVPQSELPEVGLHEHGTFFSSQITKAKPQRIQGGVDPSSNTPFHPAKTVVVRPRRYPTPAGERTSEESFVSSNTLSGKANHDVAGSRWSRIKRGAADGYVPMVTDSNGFLVPAGQPQQGVPAGTGTTGNSTTGTPSNTQQDVAQNAHSGSPYVIPAYPQRLPGAQKNQPTERGNTFPVRQNRCLKGCK